jgi:hypothetical protein
MPKTILIKAIGPCSIEKYKKDFDGVEVEVHREAFDDWNELVLTVPDAVDLPQSGTSFSVDALGIDYDIEDISSGSHVQASVITDIDDEDIEDAIYEFEASDDWSEWELIGRDYIINSYELKGS